MSDRIWRRLTISTGLAMIGWVAGSLVHIQLNTNLTGSYQDNFLGDARILRYAGAFVGAFIGTL